MVSGIGSNDSIGMVFSEVDNVFIILQWQFGLLCCVVDDIIVFWFFNGEVGIEVKV